MKSLKIDLGDLIHPMQDQSRDINEYYLDTQTGEVIWVDRFLFDQIKAGKEPDMELVPDWQQKQLEAMRAIFEDTEERYQRVPEVWSDKAYEIMVNFIRTVRNHRIADALWNAIEGRKPFRRFKDTLHRYPELLNTWYRFEEEAYKEIAKEWLDSLGIEVRS